MRQRVKSRVIRELSAALLNSGMSDSELHEFCVSIIEHDGIIEEIAHSVLMILERSDMLNEESTALSPDEIEIRDAADYLKKHRIPKQLIIEGIKDFHPSLGEHIERRNFTINNALDLFFKNSSKRDWNKLISKLTEDDYLKMLMDRI
ncbi:hypothetical protein [Aeromonas veronii]|uniref:hypothetical protein n=1 Tax=Aeromonas veronii TaxID=654 RepID=UPI0011171B58|nr:hypothetical protein [Aeromonas veronii]